MRTVIHLVFLVLALGAATVRASFAEDDSLTLRIDDAVARPGGVAAVVLRTYASRPIDLGQVCLRSPSLSRAGNAASLALRGAVVFSAANDARFDVQFDDTDPDQPGVVLTFESPSATINAEDGPLAVIFFDVDPSVPAGAEIPLALDLENTTLVDAEGLTVEIDPVDGEVEVVEADEPVVLEAQGDRSDAGMPLVVGAAFTEHRTIARGQIGVLLPPALDALPRSVDLDPRFGRATWTVDETMPGRILVAFESDDPFFGTLPGQVLRITIDTTGQPSGEHDISLDPTATALFDAEGQPLDLILETDEAIIFGGGFFAGDFESGDFSDWSNVVGN